MLKSFKSIYRDYFNLMTFAIDTRTLIGQVIMPFIMNAQLGANPESFAARFCNNDVKLIQCEFYVKNVAYLNNVVTTIYKEFEPEIEDCRTIQADLAQRRLLSLAKIVPYANFNSRVQHLLKLGVEAVKAYNLLKTIVG